MGIQIKGSNDTISSADGSIVLEGATLTFTNETVSGISTMASAEVTGNLSIADKIIHTGDTNTAIRFPAADTLTVETAGSERIRIDDNGRIGIGTLSPYSNSLLHCDGNLVLTASGNAPKIIFDEFGTGTDPKAQIEMDQESSTAASMRFYTEGSGTLTERMRILSDGKIGIGTAVPGNALELYGTSSSVQIAVDGTGRYRGFEIHEGGTRKAYFQHDATDNCALLNTAESDLKFYTGDTQRMQLDGSGRLMIGNTAAASMFSVANNLVVGSGSGSEGMTIYSDSTNDGYICFADGTGDPAYRMGQIIYSHQSNKLQFRTNGNTDRLTIDNAGNTNISGVCTATSFVPTESQLSNRNLIINGAMGIAQRGTSSTSSGFKAIDRWRMLAEGANTTLTQSQVDVAAGTTPYQLGFRKAFKILNAGQSNSNVGGDTLRIEQHIEDQIIAQSGWNYKSSSSYLTLSFWVKSSGAQNFVILLQNRSDLGASGAYTYSQNFTVGSTNTWTKITTKIPGASSLTLDNDNSRGLSVAFYMYMGGDDTAANHTDGAWQAYNNSDLAGEQNIAWWTTSNATIEYTGVQVEVGPVATPFEHLGYGRELARCQRYCQVTDDGGCGVGVANGTASGARIQMQLKTTMRAAPTVSKFGNNIYIYDGTVAVQVSGTSQEYGTPHSMEWEFDSLAAGDPLTAGRPIIAYINGSAGGFQMDAEL